ncbi:hypothetical protein [Wohlfahrtiimonas larvae]|uniref:Uncharacterized protein n=1 Tax=Wohlfahrtiimonas larvae TaxID=1157986 RepID=A0ABP9MW88_9GAMM|nr:hypothetical protein [Wohlfahrtiimonas larvae]
MATIKEKFVEFLISVDKSSNKEDIEELLNCYLSSISGCFDGLSINQAAMGLGDGRALVVTLMSNDEFVNSKEKDNG